MTLRIDTEVLEWFKAQGKGYQTNINNLLKAYMEAHLNQAEHGELNTEELIHDKHSRSKSWNEFHQVLSAYSWRIIYQIHNKQIFILASS